MYNEESKNTHNSIWKTLLKEKIETIKQDDNQIDNPEEIFKKICNYLDTKISKEQYDYTQTIFENRHYDEYTYDLKIHCPQDHYFGINTIVYYDKNKKDEFDSDLFEIYHISKHTPNKHMIEMNINLKNIKEVLNGILDIINNFDSYLIISNKEEEERKKYLEKKKDLKQQMNDLCSLKFRRHKLDDKLLNIYTNDDLLITFFNNSTILKESTDINNIEIKLPAFSAIMALQPEIDSIEFEVKTEETNE